MAQETAKERIYREKLELISDKSMWHMNFKSSTIKMMMKNAEQALELAENLPDDTDKLSVEKLEPIGYYNGAHGFLHDEFDKDCYCQGGCSMEAVYTESQVKKLTGENKVEKLQEQLNTAKYFFKNILDVNPNLHGGNSVMHLKNCVNVMKISAGKALAAIGGDDDENRL